MASQIEICNMALRSLGLTAITSFDDARQEARDCALFYEPCRDSVLRAYYWGFAQKTRALNLLTLPDNESTYYSYAYLYPVDCLKLRKIYAEGGDYTPVPYELRRISTGEQAILCNTASAMALYTRAVSDPTWFDPLFIEALSYFLASKLARPLTKSSEAEGVMLQRYGRVIMAARAMDLQESPAPDTRTDPWIAARTQS